MATRDKADPIKILQAVVDRLISQIDGLSAATCYLSIDPDSLPAKGPGDLMLVVAPTSGNFNDAYIDGGGNAQLTADGGIVVKIHSPLQIDEAHKDTAFLSDRSRGVLTMARKVLAALSCHSPTVDDDILTRDPLIPSGYVFHRSTRALGSLELTFRLSFDWDLEEPAE